MWPLALLTGDHTNKSFIIRKCMAILPHQKSGWNNKVIIIIIIIIIWLISDFNNICNILVPGKDLSS